MVGLSGLEKFSHLEDKIYRTIELTKTLRQEKESLEKELSLARRGHGNRPNETERLETTGRKAAGRTRHDSHESGGNAGRGCGSGSRDGGGTQMTAGIGQTLSKGSMDTTTTTPTIRVEIYNQTYNIRSDGDTEYIIQLAEFVDSRMREISSGTLTVDSLKVAILAALHVADELHRLKHLHEQADAQLATRSAECAEMLDRLAESPKQRGARAGRSW